MSFKDLFPQKVKDWFHFLESTFFALLFGFPGRKIKVIAITGTNGKTTVVHLASFCLEKAQNKVASISSLRFKLGAKEWKNKLKMTMPGRWILQSFLNTAVKEKCNFAVLEVTSEGIKQYRDLFLFPKVAIITNLTPEHIESHGSFLAYKKAKFKLFKKTKEVHIVNLDDSKLIDLLKLPSKVKVGYSLDSKHPLKDKVDLFVAPEKVLDTNEKISFFYQGLKFESFLYGTFNLYNILAVLSLIEVLKIPLEIFQKALREFRGVEGRMEEVVSSPFKVIVDYAHTPDALEKVYKALKERYPDKDLICVFGSAGGGRDKWKREELAKIASRYCSFCILTNEDPYDEDPEKILKDIEKGFLATNFKSYVKILDRKLAIKTAFQRASSKSLIIITGKGAEPLMCLAKGQKIPWDDRKIVRQIYDKLF